MTEEKKKLNVAQLFIATQMATWPTLYKCSDTYIAQRIFGGADTIWENGTLTAEKDYRNEPYPLAIPLEVASSLYHDTGRVLVTFTYESGHMPFKSIPDDVDDSWLDEIDYFLYKWVKITPDLYETMVEAGCIMAHGVRDNPLSSYGKNGHYNNDYRNFYKKIPSYQAKIRYIREMKRLGKIPPDSYLGMYI